jgi:thiol:disulfide interchange protein DsbD
VDDLADLDLVEGGGHGVDFLVRIDRRLRRFYGALAGLAISLVAAVGARAAPVAAPHLRLELAAETSAATPGSTVWVAVAQTIDPGWHTYWRNPGDAGEATRIVWTLPQGWRSGEVVWPAPRRLPVGPIMNYGYEGRVLLPTPIEIPPTAAVGSSQTVSATVDYLVCADVCVPGGARLSLTLPIVAGAPAPDPNWGGAIAATLAAAPKPGGLTATFTHSGGAIRLAVAGAALADLDMRDAYFYPFADNLIDHAKPQTVERGPAGLTLTLAPSPAAAAAPRAAAGVLSVDGRSFEIDAVPGPPPIGSSGLGSPTGAAGVVGLATAMAFALIGGLILNLMPCVFPILAMKATALARHAEAPAATRAGGVAFLVGAVATFLALAATLMATRAAGEAVGWGFQLQSPAVVAALVLVMLATALNLSGLFEIGTSMQGLGAGGTGRAGVIGSALTGVLAVVVAAPCTAPFMAPALAFAITQPPPVALAVFASLGVGFAAPFAALSFSPALLRRLPRPGRWMDVFRRAMAFPMFGAAAWLTWVLAQQTGPAGLAGVLAAAVALALAAWLFGLVQRQQARDEPAAALAGGAAAAAALGLLLVWLGVSGGPAPPGAARAARQDRLAGEPWSPERLAALQARHTPVLVNFTAAWCVTCQVNERVAFSSGEVAAAFRRSGAAYLVADWTSRDGAIARALAAEDRIGVPLYLVYGADGGAPRILPQLLTPGLVAGALDQASIRPAGLAAR